MKFQDAYDALQEPYRSQAIKNHDHSLGETCNYPKISDAIESGFIWAASPEGHDYWEKYSDTLKKLGL